MVQLKLGLTATTQDSINTILERLRSFGSDDITVTATDSEVDEPDVLSVTFEFDVVGDEAYRALGDQCRAWLRGNNTGVESYTLIRDP
jgi:hypothetical protein